jgi:predicted RNA binding protein YcfA (HicA-like mRNA interferase family)
MKIAELLKLLKQNGVVFVEHGKKHDLYFSPITKKAFPVPRHADQDVGKELLSAILKQAGLK